MKKRIALFGMMAVALIFSACGGDSGNNGTEVDGISSSGGQQSGFSSSSDFSSSASESSSSAKTVSLSSSLEASSSSAKVAEDYLNPNITYGEMTDTRDSQTYKTVVIGTQTWMAENLNFADSVAIPNLKGNSWCYENSADSCAKYGRLYTWTAAMNVASSYQLASASAVISTPQQGVCPSGWHVPTGAEWTTLENAVGSSDNAGTYLKATSGWYSDAYHDGYGTDAYGFSALPGGDHYGSDVINVGYYGLWWTATEYISTGAYYRTMSYGNTHVDTYLDNKKYGRSLRCLKD
ncbi:MAG: fibrobacter succinogenes major paralogous domain-containing protein [Fibrobacteraceae bacterium]|nr:fibrobacter succinogenes major paralogous domain-containing protein [Fibrobacteraceae bacterium]